jgi:hypothetical protein
VVKQAKMQGLGVVKQAKMQGNQALFQCRGSIVKMAFMHGLFGILMSLLWHSYNA